MSHRRRRPISEKTGPKRDQLEFGYRPHPNGVNTESVSDRFIPKVR